MSAVMAVSVVMVMVVVVTMDVIVAIVERAEVGVAALDAFLEDAPIASAASVVGTQIH